MTQGSTIVIKGEVSASEDLVIAGKVEGQINLSGRTLTLAPGSTVTGRITAGTVIVGGTVEGSITASSRLDVRDTATVDGDFDTPVLVIADGARVNVIVDMPAGERRKVA
jgi:cytoskeletal protein CcmA (bactofilin family)